MLLEPTTSVGGGGLYAGRSKELAELNKKRLEAAGRLLRLAILPPLVLLAIGAALLWALKGFKP